ncbi:MAG: hypothetical protein HOQ05_11130 [Corynebacteriales bacterium]|nr:hypothetical protein [Mycobacteriales bacterium]
MSDVTTPTDRTTPKISEPQTVVPTSGGSDSLASRLPTPTSVDALPRTSAPDFPRVPPEIDPLYGLGMTPSVDIKGSDEPTEPGKAVTSPGDDEPEASILAPDSSTDVPDVPDAPGGPDDPDNVADAPSEGDEPARVRRLATFAVRGNHPTDPDAATLRAMPFDFTADRNLERFREQWSEAALVVQRHLDAVETEPDRHSSARQHYERLNQLASAGLLDQRAVSTSLDGLVAALGSESLMDAVAARLLLQAHIAELVESSEPNAPVNAEPTTPTNAAVVADLPDNVIQLWPRRARVEPESPHVIAPEHSEVESAERPTQPSVESEETDVIKATHVESEAQNPAEIVDSNTTVVALDAVDLTAEPIERQTDIAAAAWDLRVLLSRVQHLYVDELAAIAEHRADLNTAQQEQLHAAATGYRKLLADVDLVVTALDPASNRWRARHGELSDHAEVLERATNLMMHPDGAPDLPGLLVHLDALIAPPTSKGALGSIEPLSMPTPSPFDLLEGLTAASEIETELETPEFTSTAPRAEQAIQLKVPIRLARRDGSVRLNFADVSLKANDPESAATLDIALAIRQSELEAERAALNMPRPGTNDHVPISVTTEALNLTRQIEMVAGLREKISMARSTGQNLTDDVSTMDRCITELARAAQAVTDDERLPDDPNLMARAWSAAEAGELTASELLVNQSLLDREYRAQLVVIDHKLVEATAPPEADADGPVDREGPLRAATELVETMASRAELAIGQLDLVASGSLREAHQVLSTVADMLRDPDRTRDTVTAANEIVQAVLDTHPGPYSDVPMPSFSDLRPALASAIPEQRVGRVELASAVDFELPPKPDEVQVPLVQLTETGVQVTSLPVDLRSAERACASAAGWLARRRETSADQRNEEAKTEELALDEVVEVWSSKTHAAFTAHPEETLLALEGQLREGSEPTAQLENALVTKMIADSIAHVLDKEVMPVVEQVRVAQLNPAVRDRLSLTVIPVLAECVRRLRPVVDDQEHPAEILDALQGSLLMVRDQPDDVEVGGEEAELIADLLAQLRESPVLEDAAQTTVLELFRHYFPAGRDSTSRSTPPSGPTQPPSTPRPSR